MSRGIRLEYSRFQTLSLSLPRKDLITLEYYSPALVTSSVTIEAGRSLAVGTCRDAARYGALGGPNGHSIGYSRGTTSVSDPVCTIRAARGGAPVRSKALAADVQSSVLTNANPSWSSASVSNSVHNLR